MRNLFSFLKRRRLRVDILTIFGGVLVLTVLAVILYTYHNTSRMVLLLSDDIMEKTTDAVIDRTMHFLIPAAKLAEISSHLAADMVSLHEDNRLERYAIEVMQAFPQITMINIGDEAGNFLMPKRLADGTIATKSIDRTVSPPLTTWKYRNPDQEVVNITTSTTDAYDPRRRPWYQAAKATGHLCWTDIYILYTDQKPGITTSYPIVDAKSNIRGVIGCDIEISNLSLFLKSLKIGENGFAFIFTQLGELVAFPDAARLVDPGKGGRLRTVSVERIDIPEVATAFRQHQQSGKKKLTVESGGKRYLASFSSFTPYFGLEWKVAVIVPEDDFIGAVKKINQRAFIICLMILGFSSILMIYFSRRITKPILRLAEETDRIGKFQLDGRLDLRSNIYEIQTLHEAVKRMQASLLSFTRFAPQQLVQEIVVQGKEAMLGGERRTVTMLFADLRNFTRFSDATAPEGVVHLLTHHFDAMVNIIAEHGGYVVDFLGDNLFAVFGAPDIDPDHAAQAVKCAVHMQLTRQQLNVAQIQQGLPALEMGIGINSGSCVVGNMGSQARIKYGVVGQAVNMAARIETFTVGGQVLISDMTYRLGQEKITALGPLEVSGKGLRTPLRLWEVRGLKGVPNAQLAPTVPELTRLLKPLPIHLRFLRGKQIEAEVHAAQLVSLSTVGAEIITDRKLEVFSSLQMQLPGSVAQNEFLDGKVVGLGEMENAYVVRFSGLDESMSSNITRFIKEQSQEPNP
ncbi:MAG: adenylate/guanylate cyclase domain-containing protein [Desulfobacteraceae bacterium]